MIGIIIKFMASKRTNYKKNDSYILIKLPCEKIECLFVSSKIVVWKHHKMKKTKFNWANLLIVFLL